MRDSRSGGRSSFGGGRGGRDRGDRGGRGSFGGGRDRGGFGGGRGSFGGGRAEMYPAVCDNCGKDCQVPFRPNSDKPIYCSDCFESVDPRRDERGSRGGRDSDAPRRERSDGGNTSAELKQLKEQMGSISAKLDKLIRILEPVLVDAGKSEKE